MQAAAVCHPTRRGTAATYSRDAGWCGGQLCLLLLPPEKQSLAYRRTFLTIMLSHFPILGPYGGPHDALLMTEGLV